MKKNLGNFSNPLLDRIKVEEVKQCLMREFNQRFGDISLEDFEDAFVAGFAVGFDTAIEVVTEEVSEMLEKNKKSS